MWNRLPREVSGGTHCLAWIGLRPPTSPLRTTRPRYPVAASLPGCSGLTVPSRWSVPRRQVRAPVGPCVLVVLSVGLRVSGPQVAGLLAWQRNVWASVALSAIEDHRLPPSDTATYAPRAPPRRRPRPCGE